MRVDGFNHKRKYGGASCFYPQLWYYSIGGFVMTEEYHAISTDDSGYEL